MKKGNKKRLKTNINIYRATSSQPTELDKPISGVNERDKGICQLCGTPVRLDVHYTHPLAPTRDHIIPLSKGGEHSYANCQLACRDCNTDKNNRVEVNLIDPTKQKRKSSSSKVTNKR